MSTCNNEERKNYWYTTYSYSTFFMNFLYTICFIRAKIFKIGSKYIKIIEVISDIKNANKKP